MVKGKDSPEYSEFLEKFRPKKTTDDCYTPPETFAAITRWVSKAYGIDPATVVRPFWPGGDYERANYPAGCVVLDNPPFSILSKIIGFYQAKGIRFFLHVFHIVLIAFLFSLIFPWLRGNKAILKYGVFIRIIILKENYRNLFLQITIQELLLKYYP